MKVGTEDKKKLGMAGILGLGALFALYYIYSLFFGGPTNGPPPPPVIVESSASGTKTVGRVVTPPGYAANTGASARPGAAAQKVGSTSGQLDPTLHMDAMHATESLVYTGSGRNIFAGAPAPSAIPIPVAHARKPVPIPVPVQTARIDPGPPPPPPINLKFFGTATTPNGARRAFLLNGDDVFLASAGDIVQRRYRVVTISANSIVVEDIPNSNKQTLPLVMN